MRKGVPEALSGICGFIHADPSVPADRELLGSMMDLMRHRGPDGAGTHIQAGASLGVRIWSSPGAKAAHQPVSNEKNSVHVLCDGEIYNAPELRRELLAAGHRFGTDSDFEVIAHLYEDLGPDCVQRLRGMFGLALWDSGCRRLLLARDRLGIKPLNYAQTPERVCFASEIKPIVLAHAETRKLHMPALQDLFSFGFILSPQTLFSGIQQLPPGHVLLYQNGTLQIRKYWQISFPADGRYDRATNPEYWADALFEKLEESVRIHLSSDVPPASWLSGGLDSSTIAALIHRLTLRPVQTYSLLFDHRGFDEFTGQKTLDCYPEYQLVPQRIVSTNKDFELFPKVVWQLETITASPAGIPYMLLAHASAPKNRVVLTGEGSDEVFGGYGWYHMNKLFRPLAVLPVSLRRLSLCGPLIPRLWPGAARSYLAPRAMNLARYQSLLSSRRIESMEQLFSENLKYEMRRAGNGYSTAPLPDEFKTWNAFAQLQYFDLTQRMTGFIANALDRATAAHGVEARVPFLDHRLVEFCATIPPSLKMKRFREKYVLRRAVRTLLPAPIVWRNKKGMQAPAAQWLRERLPDFAEEMFSRKQLLEKGYFDPSAVTALLEQHRKGTVNGWTQLFAILAVQLWDEVFLKNGMREPAVNWSA